MRILDIDLDFFLSDKSYSLVTDVERVDDFYKPWDVSNVEFFLEHNCGLSSNAKIKGRSFTHHIEVFDFLLELQTKCNFVNTFSIDHIDAHADLGMGDSSYQYISTEILSLPVEERFNVKERNGWSGLSSGNYLAFAIACRWISDLKYINNPKWFNDLPFMLFQDFDTSAKNIQLKKYDKEQMNSIIYHGDMRERVKVIMPLDLEPLVPFSMIDYNMFKSDGKYDFVLLTKSPGFTPVTSDLLIPTIQKYMALE